MELLLQYKKCLAHLGTIAIIALLLLKNYPGNQEMYPIAPCLEYNLVEYYYLLILSYLHQSYPDRVFKKTKQSEMA